MRGAHAVPVLAVAVAIAGCGSSGTKLSSPATSTTKTSLPPKLSPALSKAAANYHPKINPANFSDHVTNPYMPLTPGTTHVLVGLRDGAATRHQVTVLHQTKTIRGVRCAVIHDLVTQQGIKLEDTIDWYAQDRAGNVWYFGEATKEYSRGGTVVSTEGSWEAGVDGAQPGIAMKANPKPGPTYRQEYRPGVALDLARVLKVERTAQISGRTFHRVLVVHDINPLDPSFHERKWYAPGIGVVRTIKVGGGHTETSHIVK